MWCSLVLACMYISFFFFSSRRRHTRYIGDWSSDVCSSDLYGTNYVYLVANRAINDGSFHHVAAVRSGTTLSLYIDGNLDSQVTASGLANIRSEERRVGKECRSRWSPEPSI